MSFKYGVLFDMDGVIVDNSEFHLKAFQEWCNESGMSFDREFFEKHLFGRQNRDIFQALLGRELHPDEVAKEGGRKEALYRKVYADHVKEVDGLVEFLKELKEYGFGVAVATSGPPENVEFVSEKIGGAELFDTVITSREVKVGKPNPQVFLTAAESLGLTPEQCVVFEDSKAGAQAAVASGSALIGVSTSHAQLTGAARMISDFTEITAEQVLELIAGRN